MFNYYLYQQYILEQQYKQLYYKLNNRQNDNPVDISGVWNTNYGRVILQQDGNNIKGTFQYETGTLEGNLVGNILEAIWADEPTYECPINKGRLKFEFSPDGKSFTGLWGFCEEPLTENWSGIKLQPAPALNISGEWITANFGSVVFSQQIDKVIGTYGNKYGRIEGILEGYTLIGFWSEGPNYDCPYDKGRLEMDFDLSGRAFVGVYGYCQEEPTIAWNGVKVMRI
jgi:hypothetical protein